MHLTRIEAIGFKSFASKVNIEFMTGVNGVVGPNGCGKSNITDAIKWVLGEQSSKSLRASGMQDVIFAGSDDYKKQNLAQVTLVFDNSDKTLALDFDQVEITRRLYRNGDSEYLINKAPCRLKDITDLILDTGLGKDSLSTISQGAINQFAESKSEEKRVIFEEAAGVTKYKKSKIDSLRKLEKTNDNMTRLNDILHEKESQLEPLRKQAVDAKKYLSTKEQLEGVEVSVLVFEVDRLVNQEIQLKERIDVLRQDIVLLEKTILDDESAYELVDASNKEIDKQVSTLNDKFLKINEDYQALQKEKNELTSLSSDNSDEVYINNLKIKLNDLQVELDALNDNKDSFQSSKQKVQESLDEVSDKLKNLNLNKDDVTRQINTIEKRMGILQHNLDSGNNLHAGVKAVLNNKESLGNIDDIVKNLFSVEEEYATAIFTVLQANLQSIVVATNSDAKNAIEFLKHNSAGRASFFPLDSVKERNINDNDLYIANNSEGFIDVATNVINFDKKYQDLFGSFLNNTYVVDTIDHAIALAKRINYRSRIVTLDGEVINNNRSITGGKGKNETFNPLVLKAEIDKISLAKEDLEQKLNNLSNQIQEVELTKATYLGQKNQLNMSLSKIDANLLHISSSFTTTKNEYESLTNSSYDFDESLEEINGKIRQVSSDREMILNDIQTIRQEGFDLKDQLEKLNKQLKANRKELSSLKDDKASLDIDINNTQTHLKHALDRLAVDYKLTIDNAREVADITIDVTLAKEEVKRYREIIKQLGVVNILAIEEYEVVKESYDFLVHQISDLETSRNEILKSINETDKVMVEQFDSTFKAINEVLPDTFAKLFGGGTAYLQYTDPDNILETGIDIIARPPGKKVANLTLFSGGEKALIALSVLFSILQVKQVPLCILDEVEAALDIANVERFAKFLKEFASKTQFIVITHRTGTMEQCDILYGVTMQEAGVTKMFNVRLDQAVELIDEEAS